MKKLMIIPAIIILVVLFAGTVIAENATLSYNNAKTIGMGNAKVAGGFGYNGFIDNPALLSRVKNVKFSVINLPITLNDNFVDIGNFINDNQEKFANFDTLSTASKDKFYHDISKYDGKWAFMNASPMFDLAFSAFGQGFGVAVYNVTDIGLKLDRGIYEPRVWGEGTSHTAVVLGYSKPLTALYPGLTLGVNLKYLQRRTADLFQIKASDLGEPSDTIDPITEEVKNSTHNTVAMDVGGLLEVPAINAEVGAVINSIGDGRGASVDLGIAKRFYNDKLTLLADYMDFLDNNKENIFNKFHVGAQYQYYFLALRAGLNSGYPTVGVGLDFNVVDLDFAYFTNELGNAPGMEDDKRYIMQLKLGW